MRKTDREETTEKILFHTHQHNLQTCYLPASNRFRSLLGMSLAQSFRCLRFPAQCPVHEVDQTIYLHMAEHASRLHKVNHQLMRLCFGRRHPKRMTVSMADGRRLVTSRAKESQKVFAAAEARPCCLSGSHMARSVLRSRPTGQKSRPRLMNMTHRMCCWLGQRNLRDDACCSRYSGGNACY